MAKPKPALESVKHRTSVSLRSYVVVACELYLLKHPDFPARNFSSLVDTALAQWVFSFKDDTLAEEAKALMRKHGDLKAVRSALGIRDDGTTNDVQVLEQMAEKGEQLKKVDRKALKRGTPQSKRPSRP